MNDASVSGPPAGDHGIDEALAYCISHAEREGISLQETLGRLGPASFCFVSLLLSVPFIQPFSLGPYTFASGLTFMAGEKLVGWFVFTGGALLTIPMANLPFNNTLPALMILFAAIAWLERDGLMLIVSLFWGLLTLVYFATVAKLVWFLFAQAFHWIKSLLPPGIF